MWLQWLWMQARWRRPSERKCGGVAWSAPEVESPQAEVSPRMHQGSVDQRMASATMVEWIDGAWQYLAEKILTLKRRLSTGQWLSIRATARPQPSERCMPAEQYSTHTLPVDCDHSSSTILRKSDSTAVKNSSLFMSSHATCSVSELCSCGVCHFFDPSVHGSRCIHWHTSIGGWKCVSS